MTHILCLETSASSCSVAVHAPEAVLASVTLDEPHSAAGQLSVMIDNVIRDAGLPTGKISAVAVAAGPGSYTGLRIGASTAKGISYGLGIPMIALDSLRVLAEPVLAENTSQWICPMLDARRMEVYCCVLDKDGSVVEPSHPLVIEGNPFAERLREGTIHFVGEAVGKCRENLSHPHATFSQDVRLSAIYMGKLAHEAYRQGKFEDAATFEPKYLKEFTAKTKSQPQLL